MTIRASGLPALRPTDAPSALGPVKPLTHEGTESHRGEKQQPARKQVVGPQGQLKARARECAREREHPCGGSSVVEDEIAERADALQETVSLWRSNRAGGRAPMAGTRCSAGRVGRTPAHVAILRSVYWRKATRAIAAAAWRFFELERSRGPDAAKLIHLAGRGRARAWRTHWNHRDSRTARMTAAVSTAAVTIVAGQP